MLRRPALAPVQLREALTAGYDGWLRERLPPEATGVALAAVGSLGRREPSPCSDLDLVLLHRGRRDLTDLADAIWYPIWDAGIGLDHSVRTPDEALAVARSDIKALLGLLDLRHIAGEEAITADLRARVRQVWHVTAAKRAAELHEISAARWSVAGEAAFLLEPHLKESRGGLRDARTLGALALAQLVDVPVEVRAAASELLDVRDALHRVVGRADDVLRQQEHDPVAQALGMDRDQALRSVNGAARIIAHGLDVGFRRVDAAPRRRWLGGRPATVRVGIARDVVAQDGEVLLARDAVPRTDSALVMRAARAAAEADLPFAAYTLHRLSTEATLPDQPWPAEVRDDFVFLLGTGAPAIPVLEALDFAGLFSRLMPEWSAVRSRAQHNPVHRFTVDRHLLETAAQAALHTREVARPDLLLVGALLHDIGKGYPGDHSVVGAELARTIASRMGFDDADVGVITALVRHHLLLADTATRRDLHDPATVGIVTTAVGGSAELLDLLHALTVADAAATGPEAWSEWKAALVADLVARARAALHGNAPPDLRPLDDERRELAEAGELAVRVRGREVIVAAPDRVGVLHSTAGVLALHLLNVRQASIRTHAGMAVNSFVVEPRFGRIPDPALIRADLLRALDGGLALAERLRDKERDYAPVRPAERRPPTTSWFDEQATEATVLEIRTEDSIGLLARATAALERSHCDIRSARVSSLGYSVVLAFYLTKDRTTLDASTRERVEEGLRRL